MGRGIEEALLSQIIERAKIQGIKKINENLRTIFKNCFLSIPLDQKINN